MSLQFITGTSGQGKTSWMIRHVIACAENHPKQQYYVIVPEQFSLEMQRRIVEEHPRHGFFNIDIISFHRLAYRVFDECGYEPAEILEDLGVSMILKKILAEHVDELPYFRGSLRKPGFLDELKSVMMECISYGVSWQDLKDSSLKAEGYPVLQRKLQELSLIFQWFEKETNHRYMVSEEILHVLTDMVQDSALIREGIFYFDSFTGFTPVQTGLLAEMLSASRGIYITATTDHLTAGSDSGEEALFFMGHRTIRELTGICRRLGISVDDEISLQQEESRRFQGRSDLNYLERHLYRKKTVPCMDMPEHIHVTSCLSPDEEADYILHKIEYLVRTRGYRYRDFAVLTGNVEDYASAFERVAGILHIPLFVDVKKNLSYHPGLETIRSLFHLADQNYSYESVFRYLKSGMSRLSDTETDRLENYVYGTGIRGIRMWEQDFFRRPRGMKEDTLHVMNQLRIQFFEETEAFVRTVTKKDCTVQQQMDALKRTMDQLQYEQKLDQYADQAQERADYSREREYRQMYEMLTDLMDKIAGIFGDEILPVRETADIVDAGLEALGIGIAPLSMDQVLLGDLKRTRPSEIRILFVAGMNDGIIPPKVEDRGLILDREKEILSEIGIRLSENLEEKAQEDEFYLYQAFARPKEAIFFTCAEVDRAGGVLRPSWLLNDIQTMFPRLKVKKYGKEEIRYIFNQEDSRESLYQGIADVKYHPDVLVPAADMLLHYYWNNSRTREAVENLWMQKDRVRQFLPLDPSRTTDVFGREYQGSITQLETYAGCPYAYYMRYGLALSEREEFRVEAQDIGTLFHTALETFTRKVKESEYTFGNLTDEAQEQFLKSALESAADEKMSDLFRNTARDHYRLVRVERILRKTVKVLREHLAHSDFEPDAFELIFGKKRGMDSSEITLKQGVKMHLTGKIDRVDIFEEDDRIFVKIIDYKTGKKEFSLTDFYDGLELQLVLYMNAVQEIYADRFQKQTVPAGMYFYQVKDPMFDREKKDSDKKNAYRMSGYTNEDREVLQHLECLEDGENRMSQVSVRFKKDGSLYQDSKVMSTEDFHRVGEYANRKAKELGERLYDGDIAPVPYRNKNRSACDYCPYYTVCGFDERLPGYHSRKILAAKDSEILERIRNEVGE